MPSFPIPACRVCNAKLSFVLQVFAPLDYDSLEERVLYVFGCLAPSCGISSGNWVCVQGYNRDSQPYPSFSSSCSSSSSVIGGFQTNNDWGNEDDHENETLSTESFATVGKKMAPKGAEGPVSKKPFVAQPSQFSPNDFLCSFQSHYLEFESEPSNTPASKTQDRHIQSLIKKYEEELTLYDEDGSAKSYFDLKALQSSLSSKSAKIDHAEDSPDEWEELDDSDESDLNEEEGTVEETKSPIESVDASFLKFSLRLKRSPQQCIRYSWSGSPLWWSSQAQREFSSSFPKNCTECGLSLWFEMQILPSLLYFLEKSTNLQSGNSKLSQLHPMSKELGSVLIYACPNPQCPKLLSRQQIDYQLVPLFAFSQ